MGIHKFPRKNVYERLRLTYLDGEFFESSVYIFCLKNMPFAMAHDFLPFLKYF